ncbi:MAG: PrsW family glutamic-type intramembrane protease, partial [Candidatus Micrarchaeia archaeon]
QAMFGSFALLGTAMIAPVVEEVTKGLGILILSGHHEYKDMTDGLLYGFVIGIGFSFLENWFYFMARANPFELGLSVWIEFVTYRLLFNSMAHGAFTASCGALVGYFKEKPSVRKYAQAAWLPGVLIAIALHSLFNISAILDEVAIYAVRMPVFIFNPIMVVILAVALGFLFYFATMDTRRRVLAAKGVQA